MENLDPIQHEVRTPSEKPVSVGDWMLTILIMAIPLVNLIMLFVWAFGNNSPLSKANFAKASLIWMLICIVLSVVVLVLFAGAIFAASSLF